MQVTSHLLCHSLLIRRESLGKPTVNRRGLHKVCVPGDRDHRGPSCRLPRIPCVIKMGTVIPFGCKAGCYNKKFKYSDLHGLEVWFSLTTQQRSASLPRWRSPCLSRVPDPGSFHSVARPCPQDTVLVPSGSKLVCSHLHSNP